LVILGVILLISVPSMVIAWLKLRKRNVGPLLDANGWAVNARARINVPFGGALTQVAALPQGSSRDVVDPYAEKKSPLPVIIGILIVLAIAYGILNKLGYINDWTNGRLGTKVELRSVATEVKPNTPTGAVDLKVTPVTPAEAGPAAQ
jgi:hypothetical protein